MNVAADAEGETENVFRKLIAAAGSKLNPGQRTRLQWGKGSVCMLADTEGQLIFVVFTQFLAYPERLAYQLLYDLVAMVGSEQGVATAPEGGLSESLEPKMRDLVNYYEDAENFPQFKEALTTELTTASVNEDE